MSDVVPYHNSIDRLRGENVQVGNDCTIIYNITNHYYNHPPPVDIQGQRQRQPTYSETNVRVVKQREWSRDSGVSTSCESRVDMLGETVKLELGDTLHITYHENSLGPDSIYIGDGMIVTVRDGKVLKERLEDVEWKKVTMEFLSGVRVFSKKKAVRRAKQKIGESDTYGGEHALLCWLYTDKGSTEACACRWCNMLRGQGELRRQITSGMSTTVMSLSTFS